MTLPFPEIGNSNISLWWIWRKMGLDAMLNIAQATGREYEPVSQERIDFILDYFDSVEDVTDDESTD